MRGDERGEPTSGYSELRTEAAGEGDGDRLSEIVEARVESFCAPHVRQDDPGLDFLNERTHDPECRLESLRVTGNEGWS